MDDIVDSRLPVRLLFLSRNNSMYMSCCFFASRIAIILFLYLYMYFYRLAVNKSCSIAMNKDS